MMNLNKGLNLFLQKNPLIMDIRNVSSIEKKYAKGMNNNKEIDYCKKIIS